MTEFFADFGTYDVKITLAEGLRHRRNWRADRRQR